MSRARAHCAICDRIFALTFTGTVPGHTVAGGKPDARAVTCGGSYQPPKPGTVTAR